MNKFENVEARLVEQADIRIVQKLEDRIKHLEGKFVNGDGIGGGGSVSDKELLESVEKDKRKTKQAEDDEIERRHSNVILCRVPEDLKVSHELRRASDLQFVVDLCDGVFNIEITTADILKIYRLGRPVVGTSGRPLFVSYKSEEEKTEK